MNWLKQKTKIFLENPSGYIRLVIILSLVAFAIYALDKGYLKGTDQWLFLGMIVLLIFYISDDSQRKRLDK
ncbi:hypothetical protein D4R51_00450 [bacterium]|nr:MAG: hypothetical protein D4R51_00450 [bacterium]